MKKLSLLQFIAIAAAGKKNRIPAIKALFLVLLFSFTGYAGYAQVSVTAASGGTGICPTKAVGGGATAYTALGTMTIAESSVNDLSTGANSITLAPPSGWQFNAAVAPTLNFIAGNDITSMSSSYLAGNLVLVVNCSGETHIDQFTVTGLQVEATSTSATSGYVYSSVAFVPGITTGSSGTDFADLSLAVPLTPSVSIAVTPTGSVCAGTNLTFTPTPTNGGATPTYQWFVNGGLVGSGGTYSTSTLSNGNLIDAVMTVGGVASCTYPLTATSSNITAAINALPTAVTVSGGGSFCGSTTITAANGGSGTIYFQGNTSGGTSTASPATSEVITVSGTYYFRAQSAAGCWGTEGSVTVTINPVPGAVIVTGGTTTCGTAQTITASGGTGGIIYFENTTSGGTSTAIPSTSQSVSTSGTYYFRAEQGTCWGADGNTVVTINPLPTAFTVTGGGSYCTGGTGVAVGLSSSTSGVNYELFLGGVTTGIIKAGTGGAISFGSQTSAGNYTVVATNATTLCTNNMSGSVTVTINPLPNIYAMTGGGDYCAGGTGVAVGLSSSTLGVNYQLYIGGVPTGLPVPGNGGSITFGLQTVGSTYTSVATDANGCTSNMSGSSIVTVDPLPTAYSVTGGGSYCSGGTGVAVGLSNSAAGINYELFLGGVTTGIIVSGTGGSITFGPQTASGTYTVVATNTTTFCTKNMTGSATITINSLPTTFAMTGGGSYCFGGSGIAVGLSGSTSTVSYQLYLGGIATGLPVGGTGSAISFGPQTGTGTYTAVATDVHGCTSNMTGTAVVSTNPLPTAFSVTGGGSYCSGGTGDVVGLGGSVSGDTYQLYVGGTPTGASIPGTGSAITFGPQTTAGTYTVIATTTLTGCTNNMTGSQTITINPLPTAYTVTGGGSFCAGGTGVAVGLSGSASGVNYELFLGGVTTGIIEAGTGAAITFGLQTAGGVYTVVATNSITSCTNNMSGSATVTVDPLPNAYAVTGGGGYCVGSPGVHVGLATSDLGISYQLYRGGVATGGAFSGTGGSIDFGIETIAGVYTVIATNTSTGCTNSMTGSVTVVINPLPNAFSVTGGGPYCAGGTGVAVGLASSTIGVNYQLFLSGVAVGGVMAGSGSAITFGLQTGAGVYTAVATNATTGCTSNMTGSVTITINPLPNVYSVIGGGGYCIGGTGVHVGLASSDAGISYQLYRGGVATGIIVAGSGLSLDFGLQTISAVYTVVATNTTTTCTNNMSGSVTVTINPLPTVFTISGSGSYCAGGVGLDITLSGSQAGVNYQLYNGLVPVGGPVAGTGIGTLDMGFQTAGGVYTAVATNTTTSCTSNMTGSATIVVNPLPIAYTVTGGGSYCAGGTGVAVGLSGSDAGINYQLFLGGVATGGVVAGTGAAITFGPQATAGNYTVVATNPATTCTNNMTGSVNVIINALPNSYVVTSFGISSYCAGGTGVNIFLAGSDLGINYQLFVGGVAVGLPVAGTTGFLNFGMQTVAGTYTVVATNPVTGCTNNMTGSVTITVNPLPTAYSVTGGGQYCAGGLGVAVGLANSALGINYELFLGGVTTGIIVSGTGSAITFGSQTGAGVYTVVATNTTTTCTNNMTGSATVVINPLPTIYAVTGGGAYCAGGTGVDIQLASSDIGINYQLYNGGIATGPVMTGTGLAIDFGMQTAAGTYTVIATNATTGCTNNMSGSSTVTINPLPTAFTVTNGGSYCAGGTGVPVGLSNSTTGVTYQLFNGFTAVGLPVSGTTGSAITFGLQTAAGFYTVVATITATGCTNTMTGGVAVTIIPLPTVYNVLGGGGYCAGSTGVDVSLSGSDFGVNYQLYIGGVLTGPAMAGTGGALDFGLQTTAGVYTIVATNPITTCTDNMSGSATVVINPLPTAYAVSGGGSYCSGGLGLHVFLSSSFSGINYQLFDGIAPVGLPMAGTGGALDFGLQTAAGIYTVVATDPVTLCTNNMTGSATIVVNPLPIVYAMTGGGAYCAGGTGVLVGISGSNIGINYQLFNGGVPVGGLIAGTGSALSFSFQTAGGTYTVVGQDAVSGCQSTMSGTAVVIVNPLPTVYNLTGGGAYCSGGTGIDLLLSGSNTGISYQLWVAGLPVGSPVAGTGFGVLDLGFQTTGGVYTVVATDTTTGCTNNMTGTATIVVNPLPTAYTISAGGSYCSGGSGVDITLSNSDLTATYQLFVGGVPVVGGNMAGTGSALDFGFQPAAGTYTIVATDNATLCTNNMTGSAVIVINPLPTVYSVVGGGPYCAGGLGATVILNGSDLGINYQAYVGGVAVGSPVPGTGSPLFMLETLPGIYTIVATNATTSCTNNMAGSTTVVVNPLPAAITGATNECQGSSTTLSDATALGVWSSDNTAIATIDPISGLVSGLAAGTYNVSYTLIATGCAVSELDTVDALPVVASISGSATVCSGFVASFSDATLGGTWASSNTAIATVDPLGNVTGVTAGTATITYTVTSAFGCMTAVNADVTILTSPVVSAVTGMFPNVCTGLTLALTDPTTGGIWSSSNSALATVDGSGNVTGIAPGAATISYSVTNGLGCTVSALYPMTIGNPMPASVALPAGSATLCHGNPVDLVVVSASGGLTYQWSLGGTDIPGATDSSYIAASTGAYVATINNGTCNEVLSVINVVLPPSPVIAFDTLGNLLYTGAFTSYQWFLNGDTLASATSSTVNNPAGGSYQVAVADGNGCVDTSAAFVVIDTTVTTHVAIVTNSSDIKIYPNPATSILYIDAPVKVYVTILSTDGKILMGQKEAVSLNVGQLADGMYIIMIYDENNVLLKTDKFIKMQ